MNYRTFGRTGLNVSEIGLGTMMFGEKTGEAESLGIVDRALDAGVNLIDVADVYAAGESERLVGKALKGRRSKVLLATKVGRKTAVGEGLSRSYIVAAVEESLKRLQTDYIDLYQVHRWNSNTSLVETLQALNDLVKQGKVRYIGCSNFETWQLYKGLFLADLHSLARFESIQPRYNLAFREPEAELFPYCLSERVGVLAYSPLAGGVLTGKYLGMVPEHSRGWGNESWQQNRLSPSAQAAAESIVSTAKLLNRPAAEVALRWALAHPAVSSVLVGPRTNAQWEAALNSSSWSLSTAQAAEIAARATTT